MASDWQLKFVAQLIKQGGVIAYPTEAVWGLGCDPWNETAVLRVLDLKQRPLEKGLILIAASAQQFNFLIEQLSLEQQQRLQAYWPGPFTWLVPHHDLIPYWISGAHSRVALRVTNHPLVKKLCELTGPLVSTSANIAGLPAAKNNLMVEKYFHKQLDGLLSGALGSEKKPSRICDLITGHVIRNN